MIFGRPSQLRKSDVDRPWTYPCLSLWFLPFKTSKGGFLNIAAIWHVVPDTQICPQASSSISLFSLLHFSEQKNDSESRKQRELKQEKVARRDQIYFKCVLNLFKATVKWNFNGSQRYKKSGMVMQRLYPCLTNLIQCFHVWVALKQKRKHI